MFELLAKFLILIVIAETVFVGYGLWRIFRLESMMDVRMSNHARSMHRRVDGMEYEFRRVLEGIRRDLEGAEFAPLTPMQTNGEAAQPVARVPAGYVGKRG